MLRYLALLALIAGVLPLGAQNHPFPPPSPPPSTTLPDASQGNTRDQKTATPEDIRRKKALEKELTRQRYLEMQRDSDQLYALASELKKEVDAAGQNTLSLDVIKKAETIEKLAKAVKQRMKGD